MCRKSTLCLIALAFILALGLGRTGFAASALTLSPAGKGVFVLQGTAMENVAGMEITISYDAATLASPRVDAGSLIAGALMAPNTTRPGEVRIGVVGTTPIQGSGTIATMTFEVKGDAAGKINALSATLISLEGKPLPALVRVVNPVDTGVSPPATGVAASGPPAGEAEEQGTSDHPEPVALAETTQSPVPVLSVVVGLPGAEKGGGEPTEGTAPEERFEPTAAPEPEAEQVGESMAAAGEPALPANPSAGETQALKSVLERFQDYAGERTADAFMALFEREEAGGFRQEPAPALTDGKTPVAVVFMAESGSKDALGVAAMGARLVSVRQDPDDAGAWIVTLLPERGGSEASLAVSQEKLAMVFHLVVAPRLNIDLDRSGTVTEADFTLFLQNRAAFDLNGDGERDYRDNYLFTANYLAALQDQKAASGASR